jgi:RNA-directed DNA polymerase
MKTNNQHLNRNTSRKSDKVIVPMKQANKNGKPSAEFVEERTLIERNIHAVSSGWTQSQRTTTSKLMNVREIAKKDKNTQFNSLFHLINVDLLIKSYDSLDRTSATGIDKISWYDYSENFTENIKLLKEEIASGSYRPKPARIIYIPKADGSDREISILCLRDKIVQQAVVLILENIYEEDFLGFSYGFRKGRCQHDALDALSVGIYRKKISWVLDLDISKFFDQVDHDWLIRFLQHRIQDKRIIRLITKWLKIGYLDEKGRHHRSVVGTPQGSVISPLLSNIYLHYVYDLWCNKWREKVCSGDMIVIRYADDSVAAFQHQREANQFLYDLKVRLNKFGLKLHEDKTKLIRFGRFASSDCKKHKLGKPKTFDFLGFTHICGFTQKGNFSIVRKSIKKRLLARLKVLRKEIFNRRHRPVRETARWLCSVIRGHINYFAIHGNLNSIYLFIFEISRSWYRSLCRRSQRKRLNWEKFQKYLEPLLPRVKIMHEYPSIRFDAKYSR